jgi:deoxyribonuclease-4
MPLFGAHLSIAGGLPNAIAAAVELECGTVQIFTKNASQWAAKPLAASEVDTFAKALKRSKLRHATAHDSYLINLAAPGDELWHKSIDAFTIEIERAEALGLSYLVTHPGAHVGSGEQAGLARIAAALDEAHRRTAGAKVKVLLEATAGQGSTLGHRFEHLAFLLEHARESARLGVCVDTCHIFAAGYPIHTPEGYAATFEEFDDRIGLRRIGVFHVNDSLKGLGCRVDRHAGLGLGLIGEDCFRRLVNDVRFAKLPMILETPKEDAEGAPMDPVNLGKLRSYSKKARAGTAKSGKSPGNVTVSPL